MEAPSENNSSWGKSKSPSGAAGSSILISARTFVCKMNESVSS